MIIAFTGHRPNNPNMGGYDWDSNKNQKIREQLYIELKEIIENSNESKIHFIVGGAIGFDQFATDVCFRLKKEFKNTTIIIELAIPFIRQAIKWNEEDKKRWKEQKEKADIVTIVDELDYYQLSNVSIGIYHPAKMIKRNEYMVDRLTGENDKLIALWDGSRSGGTFRTGIYAKKNNKNIYVIDPSQI